MSPNNSHNLESSNRSTFTSQSNRNSVPPPSHTVNRKRREETFAIIHYVIYSLIGRPTGDSPSPEAEKLRDLVKDMLNKHDLYNCLCSNLNISPSNITLVFNGVAEGIFEDGHKNWGRLVALAAFSVKTAEFFRREGYGSHDDMIVELTSDFIVNNTGTWIMSQGGWGELTSHFENTACETSQFSPNKNSWFKGILVTATATIGLGALLAISCK